MEVLSGVLLCLVLRMEVISQMRIMLTVSLLVLSLGMTSSLSSSYYPAIPVTSYFSYPLDADIPKPSLSHSPKLTS